MEKVIVEDLSEIISRDSNLTKEAILGFYKDTIAHIQQFSIGKFYWLIPNQQVLRILYVSENISNLTPFKKEEWEEKDIFFWFSTIHPDDRDFVSSAMAKFLAIQNEFGKEKGENIFANIYLRMLNHENQFRWVLLQFPKWMYDSNQTIISTLVVVTDLSHILQDFEKLFTVIDYQNGSQVYVSKQIADEDTPKLLVSLTPREMEILQLMVKGFDTPKIAEKLSISYNTVENHKSNLRRKTQTHTSAQLIDFLWKNCILGISK